MSQIDRCPYCNRRILKHKHPFTRSLGNIIIKIARRFGPEEPFHLQHDLALTKSEYANFQKLQYFGLVAQYFDGRQKRLGGFWYLTWKAMELINGEAVHRWVKTFNNTVVEVSIHKTTLEDAIGSFERPQKWARRAETQKVWL